MSLKRPSELEKELRSLLLREAPAGIKSTLLNLVIVAGNDLEASEAFLSALSGVRPARIIRLSAREGLEPQADVSARCSLTSPSRSVCFEIIELGSSSFTAPGGKQGALTEPHSARFWSPLLVRELPAILLHLESPVLFETFLADAYDSIDLAVFDSSRFGKLQKRTWPVPVADLAWLRLAPLRKATASLFQPAATRNLLPALASIDISGFPAPEAQLYAGWVASRLGEKRSLGLRQLAGKGRRDVRFGFSTGETCTITPDACCDLVLPGGERQTVMIRTPGDGELFLGLLDYPYDETQYASAVRGLESVTIAND